MKKKLIFIFSAILLVSCSRNLTGNSIVIGANRESILLDPSKIYAIDETGAKISISPPISDASSAKWSPDRRWILYETEGVEPHQITIISADGRQEFRLTNDQQTHVSGATWSPDGNQIAVHYTYSNGEGGIYISDVSCIRQKPNCEFDFHFITEGYTPSWSPDSKQLAFWLSNKQVAVLSLEIPQNINVISPKDIDCYELAWSPVGNEIAIRCFVPYQGNNIFLVNSDGGKFRNITNSKSNDLLPTWSPDGTKIVFASDRGVGLGKSIIYPGISSNAVYIMNRDGTDVKRISPYNNERIQWIDWVGP